jgi:hypothetical protein
MNRSIALALIAFLMTALSGGRAAADQPQTRPVSSASGAVRAYVDLLKSGKSAQAIGTYFDTDALFAAAFGADMSKVTPEQTRQMSVQMKGALRQLLANPTIADAMAHGTFSGFDENPAGEGKAFVTVRFAYRDLKSISNYLVKKTAAGWRIVDIQMNRKPSIAAAMRDDYQVQKQQTPDLTPEEFVQSFSEQIQDAAKRQTTQPTR